MKLRVTDQFLWDLYKFLEKADNVIDFVLSNKYKQKSILMGDVDPIIGKYQREMGRREFNNFIYYLKRKNYIKAKNLENKKGFIITKYGLSKALKASFIENKNNKRKDKKWIMLIFDMPSKNRKKRDLMRSILINLGYKMFQQSVWITPYDVSEKTEKLLQLYSLDNYVKILLIEEI